MISGKKVLRGAVILVTALFLQTGNVIAHVEEGHMPDAVAEVEYKILLEFKPRDFATRTKLALVLIRQKKLDEAERELDRAAALAAKDPLVLEGFVVLKLKQQKVSEALEYAKKAIGISPERASGYLHYGKALEADGKPEMALEIYRTGLQKLTNNPDEHDRQQLDGAIKDLGAGRLAPVGNL